MAGDANHDGRSSGGTDMGDERLAAIEREHVEQLARAHDALAQAQDRSYWLDRWGVDLNAAMHRPGARRARAALRAVREVKRGALAVERYARARLGELRTAKVEDELSASAPAPRPEPTGAANGDGSARRS